MGARNTDDTEDSDAPLPWTPDWWDWLEPGSPLRCQKSLGGETKLTVIEPPQGPGCADPRTFVARAQLERPKSKAAPVLHGPASVLTEPKTSKVTPGRAGARRPASTFQSVGKGIA